ncbi:MAG: tail fiber domain-containing protein [bacterium]|nr:tail fiber domain-containing protein [bacterium]
MFQKNFFYQVLPVVIAGLAITAVVAFAWTEPSLAPPQDNVAAPLNVGSGGQSKIGGLILNTGGAPNGLIVQLGNVGIGTASPGAQLHLADVYSAGGKNLIIGDDTFLSDIDVANTLGIYGNQNSTIASIKLGSGGGTISGYAGNVGIGTTGPGAKLEVIGDISLPSSGGNKQIYTWSPTDANWRIGMSASPGFTRGLATSHVEYLTFANGVGQGFAVGDNVSGLSAFEVTGSGNGYNAYFRGNVGIGTASPGSKLYVQGGQLKVNEAEAGAGELRVGAAWGYPGIYGESASKSLVLGSATGNIFMNGNVGIGTANPGLKLDVQGAAIIRDALIVNQDVRIGLPPGDLSGPYSGKLLVYGGLELGTGRAWEGPYTPNSTYYDDSNFILFRDRTGSWSEDFIGYKDNAFYFADAVGGGDTSNPWIGLGSGYGTISSRTFKENINPLAPADYQYILSQIKDLDLVRFNFKNSDEQRHLGVIAEDMPQELIRDGKFLLGVDFAAFTLAGVKALQQENEILKQRIEKLEAQLSK